MPEFAPLTSLNTETNPTIDPTVTKAALTLLRRDPKFRAYVGTGDVDACLDVVDGSNQTLATEIETEDVDDAPAAESVLPNPKNKDSGRKFKSSKPNQALLWALIDDSPQGAEDHELAVSIMNGWESGPWKGQIWKARTHEPGSKPDRVWVAPCVDGIWSGSEWLPYTGLPVVHKPLIYPEQTKASVRLTELFRVQLDRDTQLQGITIEDLEVNQAYDAYLLNPETELDNLKVTIAAYARSKNRMADYRKFMRRNPEIDTTADDVFMEFAVYLFKYLPSYEHSGKLDRWVNMSWHKHFWPSYQAKVIGYLDSTRFMNNADPYSRGYVHYGHAVRTEEISTDSDMAEANGDVTTVERFLREMNDPKGNSPYFHLSAASKLMLQGALQGETTKMASKRLAVTPQHALKLMKAAEKEAQEITQSLTLSDVQGSAEENNVLPWPTDETFDIQASADSASAKFLTSDEAAAYLGGINSRTLTRWAREGYLPAIPLGEGKRRLWRFLQTDLDEWMMARRQGGQNAA